VTRRNRIALLGAGAMVLVGGVVAAGVAVKGGALRARSSPSAAPSVVASARPAAEERCDEHGWCRPQPLRGARPADGGETLASVWAAAPDDVHAVSLSGTHFRFNGVRWTGRSTGLRILRHVHGAAADAVWLVGGQTALLYDGQQLRHFPVPVAGELHGVYAVARDDVWAVSDAGQTAHFDGTAWSAVATPFRGWLLAVWGAKSNDVWAAGGGEDGTNTGTVLRWNGQAWTAIALPRWTNIEALAGTASDDVWAAGSWGTLLHWDGARWTEVTSPASRGLNGLWARARDDVWAVGEDGAVLRFDGQRWAGAKPDWRWLRGVTGTPSRELFAVGTHGLVLHFRGEGRRLEPPLPPRRPPPPAAPAATAAPAAMDPEYEAEFRRARQLLAEGRIEAASRAFIAASGRDRVVNVRPIVERAHMLLTRGEGTSVPFTLDELAAELEAGTGSGDAELEAQAWYNLSLLYARRGEAERERAALGRSLLRRELPSVRAKLGARPACAAEVHAAGGPQVVTGWVGVCRGLGRCREGETMTAAAARELVGETCALPADAADGSRGCEGDGPWESTFAHDPSASQRSFIAALGGDRFFVASVRVESAPLRCQGAATPSFGLSGALVTVTTAHERLRAAPGRVLPQESVDEGACLELPAATTTAVFELDTAKALGAVTVVDHHGVTVTLDAERSRLALEGGGCDGCFVPLDGGVRLSCR